MYKQTAAVMESNIEPPNESNHPPCPPSSFSSLPQDIVVSCLARISKSYYPKLCLVSKNFQSLVLSKELQQVRTQLKTQEECVYLGLKLRSRPCFNWFSLWIKPEHQTLTQCAIQEKSTRNLLVPVPSSYSRRLSNMIFARVGMIFARVGSEIYKIGRQDSHSSVVELYNELTGKRRVAPSMMVPRQEALVCVLDGKIFVMGGCRAEESTNWAEVFDPETQTWESLPDPGPEVRFSTTKKLQVINGKISVLTKTNVKTRKKKNFVLSQEKKKKYFVYLPKENKWEVVLGLGIRYVIDNVYYYFVDKKWWWRETMSEELRLVNGLTGLDAYIINDIEIGTYGGKLVMFWDSFALSPDDQTKQIWCAVILLDKRLNGEVWGQIEWVDIVRTVPLSYTLGRCVNLAT